MTDNKEWKSPSQKVTDCINYHKESLNQDILVPIKFLVDSKKVSPMNAWSNAVSLINLISDKIKSIYPTYSIGTISSFEPIKNMKLYDRMGEGDPYVELEKFFTRRELQKYITLEYITASDILPQIKQHINNYLNTMNISIQEAYNRFRSYYPSETKEEKDMDDLCYPNFELDLSIKFEHRDGVKRIIESIGSDLPECLILQKIDFDKYEHLSTYNQAIQLNTNTLLVSMVNTLNPLNIDLCRASTGYLYNVPKYLMSLFRDLAKLKCRIRFDDRKYYINPLEFVQIRNKSFYNCLDNFKKKAYKKLICDKLAKKELPKDTSNYILIEDEQIKDCDSKVELICFICDYIWPVSIDQHINAESKCPSCAQNVKYTLERFLKRAKDIHGDKFDYADTKEKHIKNNQSNIFFTCKKCKHSSTMSINYHLDRGGGCSRCGHGMWYPERIIEEGIRIYSGIYSYDKLIEEGIKIDTVQTHIPVFCKKCQETWYPTINTHINQRKGCPICKNSKGEQAIRLYFKENNIIPERQFIIEHSLVNKGWSKKYDFKFIYKNRLYIIEFDGGQHFNFHKNINKFKSNQQIDINKTQIAIDNGYFIIRIDHTQLKEIGNHIYEAIVNISSNPSNKYYFSNSEMYKHIIDNINI